MKHTIWTRLRTQTTTSHIPYFISIDGDLISKEYKDKAGRTRKAREYSPVKDKKGYYRIAINKKTYITPSIHRNVALMFIPTYMGNQKLIT